MPRPVEDEEAKPLVALAGASGFVGSHLSSVKSVDRKGQPKANPRARTRRFDRAALKAERRVRSVQRMSYPDLWSAEDVAIEYAAWLTRRFNARKEPSLSIFQQD